MMSKLLFIFYLFKTTQRKLKHFTWISRHILVSKRGIAPDAPPRRIYLRFLFKVSDITERNPTERERAFCTRGRLFFNPQTAFTSL